MPTILLKKSDTPGSVPGTANLTNLAGGVEVAVNTADKRMFSMTSASAVIELGTNPSSLTCADASFTVARITSLTISSLSLTNATFASATITNLTSTSATISSALTLSGGTANGVLYLNGSKVATSGSALTFDGTNLGIGTASPSAKLSISGGNVFVDNANGSVIIRNADGTNQQQIRLRMASNDGVLDVTRASGTAPNLIFGTEGSEKMRLTDGGNLGIGTSSPAGKLDVQTASGSGNAVYMRGGTYTNISFATGIRFLQPASTLNANRQFRFTSGDSALTIQGIDGSGSDATDTNLILQPSGGNVGIGTSSPGYSLDIIKDANSFVGERIRNNDAGSSAYAGLILNASGNSWGIRMGSSAANSNALQFAVDAVSAPSTLMTLTTSGNLGLGVTPSAWGTLKAMQVGLTGFSAGHGVAEAYYAGSNAYYDGSNWRYTANGYAAYCLTSAGNFAWQIAPSGTAGGTISFTQAMTLEAGGDLKLTSSATNLYIQPSTGTNSALTRNINTGGTVYVGIDSSAGGLGGAYTANFWHTGNYAMVFATNNTERARITAGGQLLVGTTTTVVSGAEIAGFQGGVGLGVKSTGGDSSFAGAFWNDATTGDNVLIRFYTETAGTQRGTITYNRGGGVIAYNTTSDYRAKEVYGAVENSGEQIDALKIYRGKMKDATIERPMLIAHEAQEIVPYAVCGEKDAVDEDGKPKYQTMDHQILVPLLIAELQSLRKRVAELENK